MNAYRIINADILSGLAQLDDHSVDVIFLSPPYYRLRWYDNAETIWGGNPDCNHEWIESEKFYSTIGTRKGKERFSKGGEENAQRIRQSRWITSTTCAKCGAWYGQLGWEPTPQQYISHLLMFTAEFKRILKPTGICWFNIADTYNSDRRELYGIPPKSLCGIPQRFMLGAISNKWSVRNDIVWYKSHSPTEPRVKDRCIKSHEYLYMMTRGYTYESAFPSVPHDVWITSTRNTNNSKHIAKMNLDLPLKALSLSLDREGIVLDPMAGSGSTGEAALELGHRFIGIDIDPKNCTEMENKFKEYEILFRSGI